MVLSSNQIYELNKQMVAGGAPDIKDEVGYNKPDYVIMERFSRRAEESISITEYYNMCLCLLHYKNTQLNGYKEELEETKNYLRDKADKDVVNILETQIGYLYHKDKEQRRKEQEQIRQQNKDKAREEYLEQVRTSIKVEKEDSFMIEVSWKGRVSEMADFVRTTNGIKWQKNETEPLWTLKVDTRVLGKFADFMAKFGYDTTVLG